MTWVQKTRGIGPAVIYLGGIFCMPGNSNITLVHTDPERLTLILQVKYIYYMYISKA